jgi:SAM-dependent methyltransferase
VDKLEFETMLALDERHWWYHGRRRVLDAVLQGVDIPHGARLLDAGCGSGRTLNELARLGEAHGMELNPAGVAAARARGHHVLEGRVEAIPFEDASFDVVTCLDVIEHTDDGAALRELRRVTRPGGRLVVTVPAHPGLWSRHDEVNGHRRRYTRKTLRQAAEGTGWAVERLTGFNVVYLVPAALVRLRRREQPRSNGGSELELTPRALDSMLELPFRLEAALVRRGVDLPPGLSLLGVLR